LASDFERGDEEALSFVQTLRPPALNAAARLVSSKTFRLIGLAAAAGLARQQGVEAPLRTSTLAAAAGHLAGAAAGRVAPRDRPPTAERDDGFSFPSTHAVSAFAVAAALGMQARQLRLALFAGASLVAASRVVLGEHYPIDVVGGSLLGMAVGALVGLRLRNEPAKWKRSSLSELFSWWLCSSA
jgi:membrane-associated phospholipid phosphatase